MGFVPNEARGYPTRAAIAPRSTPYGVGGGSESYLSEVFGLGKYHKVGLVEEMSSGRTWCLQSDEGASLGGSNLAPAPLFQWLAGLQGDVASRVLAVARSRSIAIEHLHVGVSQSLASKGSFARGEAVALIFGLDWDVDVRGSAGDIEVEDVVDTALRSSPAVAAMRDAKEGLFALTTNGQPTPLDGLSPWENPFVVDPRARYDAIPGATGEKTDQVYTFVEGRIGRPEGQAKVAAVSSPDASDRPTGFYVDARGEVDLETGLMRTITGTPELSADRWVIVMDPRGQYAPAPLAMFAIGAAFCYHTQLSRYVNVRRLDLADSSLAQWSAYTSVDHADQGTALAGHILTHLFLNGGAAEDETRSLLKVAARTCYVHRAMSMEVAMTTDISTNPA